MRIPSASYVMKIVSLLFCLLTGFGGGAYGYVWCLGEDGHSRVERTLDGSCDSDRAAADHCILLEFGGSPSSQGEHCGPCLDVPQSFSAAGSRTVQADRAGILAHFLPAPRNPAFPSFSEALLFEPSFRFAPLPNRTLVSLRTVVLLN